MTQAQHLVTEIQVAGRVFFEGNRWREAVLAYLNGIWADDSGVTYRPKIMLNNTVLRIHGEEYVGYYSSDPEKGDRPRVADKDVLVIPNPTQAEVENGLIRFVKNNQIRQLGICFPGKGQIVLTKGNKRSQLFVVTEGNFQSQDQFAHSLGYKV
jgi:hypothetical protein